MTLVPREIRLHDSDTTGVMFKKSYIAYNSATVIIDHIKVLFPLSYLKINKWENREGCIIICRMNGIVRAVFLEEKRPIQSIAKIEETKKLNYLFEAVMGNHVAKLIYELGPKCNVWFTTLPSKLIKYKSKTHVMINSYMENLTKTLNLDPEGWVISEDDSICIRIVHKDDCLRVKVRIFDN